VDKKRDGIIIPKEYLNKLFMRKSLTGTESSFSRWYRTTVLEYLLSANNL
jgi:hypothetical protein